MIGNIQFNLQNIRLHQHKLIMPATQYSVNYKYESQNQYHVR